MANMNDLFPNAQRFLRCRKSHRYFTGNGWTDDSSLAQAFPYGVDAARACVTYNLHDVELVLRTQHTGVELFTTPVR
jgi:hypothetical protein